MLIQLFEVMQILAEGDKLLYIFVSANVEENRLVDEGLIVAYELRNGPFLEIYALFILFLLDTLIRKIQFFTRLKMLEGLFC